jgi:hypothetical protein
LTPQGTDIIEVIATSPKIAASTSDTVHVPELTAESIPENEEGFKADNPTMDLQRLQIPPGICNLH